MMPSDVCRLRRRDKLDAADRCKSAANAQNQVHYAKLLRGGGAWGACFSSASKHASRAHVDNANRTARGESAGKRKTKRSSPNLEPRLATRIFEPASSRRTEESLSPLTRLLFLVLLPSPRTSTPASSPVDSSMRQSAPRHAQLAVGARTPSS